MDITVSDIHEDLEAFRQRIAAARARLEAQPSGRLPFAEHKKREKIRAACRSEIEHVRRLIEYAEEGLTLWQ